MKKYIIIIMFVSFVLSSCEKADKQFLIQNEQDLTTNQTYKHYLEVDFEQVNRDKSLTEKELKYKTEIVYTAFKRASEHIEQIDGILYFKLKNHNEINVSPELFKLIKNYVHEVNAVTLKNMKENPSKTKHFKQQNAKSVKIMHISNWNWNNTYKMYKTYSEN